VIEIKPFAGLRFAVEKVGSLDLVTCPPYDVISDEKRDELYKRSKYNVVRLVLGKTFDSDNELDNRYTRAAALLQQWQREGVLRKDSQPALYAYEQCFAVGGREYVRFGFIAAVGLQDFSSGEILPHEQTLSKPKADRLRLLRATKANLSPIFGLYSDEACFVEATLRELIRGKDPDVAVDDSRTVNRIWPVTDRDAIEAVSRRLQDRQVLIADGHHRYETCLDYQKEVRKQLGPNADGRKLASDYTMMMLVNMCGSGLVVLPTHRLVFGIDKFDPSDFVEKCAKWFEIEEIDPGRLATVDDMTPYRFLDSLTGGRKQTDSTFTFGLYMDGKLYLLRLGSDRSRVEALMDSSHSDAWRRLDVSILHSVVIGHILGISEEDQLNQTHLKYTRSLREAVSLVDTGRCQAAFLMNPTSIEEIQLVASSGETMPQKSTYFYPKLLTGLVLRTLDPEMH